MTPLSSTYLLILYNFMNIIHTCITIRLNYPMTPLYHHNKLMYVYPLATK